MLTLSEQERLTGDIFRTTYEAVNLEELGSQVLPILDRFLNTSTSLLYRCNERCELVAIAGPLKEGHYVYAEHYYSTDILQKELHRTNPLILHGRSMPNYKEYLAGAAHTECSTHYGFDNFLHLRLNDRGMHDPGMVGMLLARTSRQADFSERERMIVGSLMPALEALTRRNERLEERLKQQPFIESLFELTQSPTIALDPRGGFLWASERADALLKISSGGRKNVPEVLVKAARQLGELIVKRSNFSIPPVAVAISQKDGIFIRADLHLARTRSGTHFIVAELENPGVSPRLAEIAARYRLTKTETQVFKLISAGLSDREISRRLFISPATVHSHVNHILAKLGVHSRVQAALVAHGIKPS